MTSSGKDSGEASRGWSILRDLVSRYRRRMALLAGASFSGALLEALFLLAVTGVAVALVGGQSEVGPVLGKSMSIGSPSSSRRRCSWSASYSLS